MNTGLDKNGHTYYEIQWIRVTILPEKNRLRINAISPNGKIKQGPEIPYESLNQITNIITQLKDTF
jgi:hypothetical protein